MDKNGYHNKVINGILNFVNSGIGSY